MTDFTIERIYLPQLLTEEVSPVLPRTDLDPVEFQRELLRYLQEHEQYMKRLFSKFAPDDMEATMFSIPNGEMPNTHSDRMYMIHFSYTGDGINPRTLEAAPPGYALREIHIRRIATGTRASIRGWGNGDSSESWNVASQADSTEVLIGLGTDAHHIELSGSSGGIMNKVDVSYIGHAHGELMKVY